ncbi:MAG: hypothetical protein AAGB22_05185 [Bacteroidota bacterium]
MKRLVPTFLAVMVLSLASCEKCATCTRTTDTGATLEDEFCESGKTYDNTLEVFELEGWACTED